MPDPPGRDLARDAMTGAVVDAATIPASLGAAIRAVLRIAGPLVAHGLVTVVVTMNDVVLLGRSGAEVLGASAAAGSVAVVAVMLLAGLAGTSTQILVARAIGAGSGVAAARAAERSVPVVVVSSLVLAIGGFAFAGPLVVVIGGTAIDPDLAASMLRVLLLGLLFSGITAIARGYATGLGQTRIVVISALVAAAVDTGLSLTLLPLVGPLGVTAATALAYAAGLATFLVWLRSRRRSGGVAPRLLRAMATLPGPDQREPLALGWSEALLGATSGGAYVVVTLLLSTGRPEVLAASRSIEAMITVLWTLLMGISSAGLTLLAQARGADSREGYRRALKAALVVSGSIGLTLAFALPGVTVPLLSLAVGDAIAAEAAPAAWLAWLQAPWIILSTLSLSVCRSFRDTRTPMWASVVTEYAVFLPVGWLLCRVAGQGIVGLFLAHHIFYVAFVAIAGGAAVAHLRRPWRKPSPFEAVSRSETNLR